MVFVLYIDFVSRFTLTVVVFLFAGRKYNSKRFKRVSVYCEDILINLYRSRFSTEFSVALQNLIPSFVNALFFPVEKCIF